MAELPSSANENTSGPSKMEEGSLDFIHPKKRRLARPQKTITKAPINTENRSEAIPEGEGPDEGGSDADTEDDDRSERSQQFIQSQRKKPEIKNDKIEPIIVNGKATDHQSLINTIKRKTENKFTVKYTKNNTNIYLTDKKDKNNLITYFKQTSNEFHTYTDSSDKTHSFVIKGLGYKIDNEDLKEELQSYTSVKQIYKMNTSEYNNMYMAILNKDATLTYLNKTIQYLLSTRVTWERVINSRQIVQCHRCQRWGHATANCGHNPRCLKCGNKHWTADCAEKDKESFTPKCANCEAAHLANNTNCKFYSYAIENRNLNSNKGRRQQQQSQHQPQKPIYKDAPLPSHNHWTGNPNNNRNNFVPGYPQLPTQRRQAQEQQQQHQEADQQEPPRRRAPEAQRSTTNNTQQAHNSCMDEFDEINKHVNMGEMLRALKDLNVMFKNCTTSRDKFQTYINFLDHLQSYKI